MKQKIDIFDPLLTDPNHMDPKPMVAYSWGAREPGYHETFRLSRNFCNHSRCFDFKVFSFFLSNEGILPITCRKYFLVTGRNFLALQVINCHRKKFLVKERNLLPRAEISRHKKKFLVKGRHFLSQEEIFCHRKKFLV